MGSNKKQNKIKKQKTKIHLVFDEKKRKEFLTGFRKRKLQRQKEAKEKFEHDLKEERKRIKSEAKEMYKKLVVSYKPIPELTALLDEKYEDEDVSVKVVELDNLADQSNCIGINAPQYKEDPVQEDIDNDKDSENEVHGMDLKRKPAPSKKKEVKKFETTKDIKKVIKKHATKKVKESKVFQRKNKMEHQKQIKKSRHIKKENLKRERKSRGKRKQKKH